MGHQCRQRAKDHTAPGVSQNAGLLPGKWPYEASEPLVLQDESVLAEHHPEFFHEKIKQDLTIHFIFNLRSVPLLCKALALHGMIFPIKSQNQQPPSTWRKKHSRQRGELGAGGG